MKDERDSKDIFGNIMQVTQRNSADMLAASANYLMGDTDEKTPLVIIRDTNVVFDESFDNNLLKMEKSRCMFSTLYN